MDYINIKQFRLAADATIAIFYAACFLITLLISNEMIVSLLNSMVHNIDFSTLIRTTPTSFTEVLVGVVGWFITGWVIGTGTAFFYNITSKSK